MHPANPFIPDIWEGLGKSETPPQWKSSGTREGASEEGICPGVGVVPSSATGL